MPHAKVLNVNDCKVSLLLHCRIGSTMAVIGRLPYSRQSFKPRCIVSFSMTNLYEGMQIEEKTSLKTINFKNMHFDLVS